MRTLKRARMLASFICIFSSLASYLVKFSSRLGRASQSVRLLGKITEMFRVFMDTRAYAFLHMRAHAPRVAVKTAACVSPV